jgi:pimeloyl-ACP methyl ester carboxylesterase
MVAHIERMVSVRGGMFSVQVAEGGSGDPLIFLHGAGGYVGWPDFLDRLAEKYHVYAPAHPGVSESTGLNHLDDLWDLVQFYEELLDALGIERCHVIGHSYGGFCAAELAAHRPDRVSRLVLVNSLGLWLDDKPIADFFILTPDERREMLWYDSDGDLAKAYVTPPEGIEEQLEYTLDRLQTLQSVAKFTWPIPERGLTKRAHRITMPTLVLWGDADQVIPPEYGAAFRDLLPNASLTVIPQCGHIPQLECPDAFHDSVAGFLTA